MEPVIEESRATIDAQLEALTAGHIPAVMLPLGSEYAPSTISAHLRHITIRAGAGAGTYIFDPKQIAIANLLALVNSGNHHRLLGHVQPKAQIVGPSVVVRAVRADGVALQDSLTSDDELSIYEQTQVLRKRFPNASFIGEVRPEKVIEERVESRAASSILQAFKQDDYRIGDLQAIGYLRTNTEMFPEGYLGRLYAKMKTGTSGKMGRSYLQKLFCGMQDLSFDAIVPYLATRPICIMGVWRDGEIDPDTGDPGPRYFHEAGFIFPTVNCGAGDEKAAFAGYGFFRDFWGSEESKTLAMLGLSFFFVELGLCAIHGIRYDTNALTRNFLAPFGFQDTGTLKKHMLRDGKLVDGVASTLLREDFERYVENHLVEEFERAQALPDEQEPEQRPLWE